MVKSKFFDAAEDLVAASMQALRALRAHKDIQSRMAYENLLVALNKIGVKHALKNFEKEQKDAA